MKKSEQKRSFLDRIHTPHWLTFLLGVIFVLRIPSFFEPFSYGDEMIYLTLGEGIRKGLTLYKDIHDNKPPLLYFTAGLAGNVFWFRVILAAWMMATTIVFWKLVKHFFSKNTLIQKVATIVFAIFTTIPLLEGQTANAEVFMIGPTILAFYILLSKSHTLKNTFIAGLILSISTLFKVPAMFDIGAIVYLWFILLLLNKVSLKNTLSHILVLSLSFILPILITIFWYASRGAFQDYMSAAFLQNVGYLSSWRPSDVQQSFVIRNAPLLTRGGLLLLGLLLLTLFRKKLSQPYLFSAAWLLFSLFGVTLSERPYPHYLIQAIPAASILAGMVIGRKNIEQSLSIFPLLMLFAVPVYYKFWYYPSLPYYTRFARLTLGQTTKEEYLNSFEGNVNRNYEIAKIIASSTKPTDQIFVWGDSSTIYALSRRLPPTKYVATYHILDFSSKEETLKMIIDKKPKYIVILPDSPSFSELTPIVSENYISLAPIKGAIIWRLKSTGVK